MSKQFLKMEKYNEYVIFQVYSKNGQKLEKSNRFYCEINTLKTLEYNKKVIDQDINYFLEITVIKDLLKLKFSFLENYSINSITGSYYYITVNFNKIVDFILSNSQKQFLSNIIEKNDCQLILHNSIKSILDNKIYRKKIRKQLVKLKDVYCYKKCNIGLDFWSTSDLYFKYENGYNGGIIFHKDYKNPNDLRLGKYSMHT